jgi:hypothetical protein
VSPRLFWGKVFIAKKLILPVYAGDFAHSALILIDVGAEAEGVEWKGKILGWVQR